MGPYILVSADTHTTPRVEDIRPYIDPRYRADFDAWSPRMWGAPSAERRREAIRKGTNTHDPDWLTQLNEHPRVKAGGETGYYDYKTRVRELELDGVVGEVIFPNGDLPFGFGFGPAGLFSHRSQADAGVIEPAELRQEGARAYNRWLADRCSENPGRAAGVAVINIYSIDAAVQDIQAAYDAGLRGGIILPDGMRGDDYPLLNHPRYEPIWEICEALDLPVNNHPAIAGTPTPLPGPGVELLNFFEVHYRVKRQFYTMLFGGVFERHPKLKFVFTEAGVDWVPELLSDLDAKYFAGTVSPRANLKHVKRLAMGIAHLADVEYTATAWEIWRRQCWGGASFMPRAEAEMRHKIGVDRLMWGSDYPHQEGTWPRTKEWLRNTFHGLPDDEVRLMLGENALKCYSAGFDRKNILEAAQRVGPTEVAV